MMLACCVTVFCTVWQCFVLCHAVDIPCGIVLHCVVLLIYCVTVFCAMLTMEKTVVELVGRCLISSGRCHLGQLVY